MFHIFSLVAGFMTAAFLSLAVVPAHATIVGGAVTGGSALGLGIFLLISPCHYFPLRRPTLLAKTISKTPIWTDLTKSRILF